MRYFKTQQYYMLQMVNNLLKKKQNELIKQVPVLKKLIGSYLEKFDGIHQMVIGKLNTTVLNTSEKNKAKKGLIDKTEKLISVLRAYHSNENDKVMPEVASYTFTHLNKASKENLSKMSGAVIKAIRDIEELRDYGIFEGDIVEAESYHKEFSSVKTAPQLSKKAIANRNAKINKDIKETIIFLENKIDPLMKIATENNPELLVRYNSFRKVLERGPGAISEKETRYRKSRAKKKKK